jgi:hypothetical protein
MSKPSISQQLRTAFSQEDEAGFEKIVQTLEHVGNGTFIPLPANWRLNTPPHLGSYPIGVESTTSVTVLYRNFAKENGRGRDFPWGQPHAVGSTSDIIAFLIR